MSGVEAREIVESEVVRELFGPTEEGRRVGSPVDCSSGIIRFNSRDDMKGEFYDAATGEELITVGNPLQRYGVGVLHGGGTFGNDFSSDATASDPEDLNGIAGLPSNSDINSSHSIEVNLASGHDSADGDDFDLLDANKFKPSAMGISFRCDPEAEGHIAVELTGARYEKIEVSWGGEKDSTSWWRRVPFRAKGVINGTDLLTSSRILRTITLAGSDEDLHLPSLKYFSRPVQGADEEIGRLITVVAVNDRSGRGPEKALFQVGFSAVAANGCVIQAYPEKQHVELDEEERSIELLYRNKKTYAIGHGCSAEWTSSESGDVTVVKSVALPAYEVVSLTPDIYLTDSDGDYLRDDDGNRQPVTVSMEGLSRDSEAARSQVDSLLAHYEAWILTRRAEITDLPSNLQEAASRHMNLADDALERMKNGWGLVQEDERVGRAFRWANTAMLYQQVRSSLPLRKVHTRKNGTNYVEGDHPTANVPPGRGNWRPFQIAFILASLPEICDPEHPNRALVDLIFFPTGGGKTEAYLGACAVSILVRRLRNPADCGTDSIMRYTLRLLTAQQFLRASSLICVLESLRMENPGLLGDTPISIGIWLGSSSTPNHWSDATRSLKRMRTDSYEPNLFLLSRCPWCGSEMGRKRGQGGRQVVFGYEQTGSKVSFICVDQDCLYSGRRGLPIHVVDEDIYDTRPSLVIGTVDKFAMLAWKPEARAIFGIDRQGERECSPPTLVIQDELHLISGPLGSMVGLYEPVINELCTDRRDGKVTEPKIIASTATIRRYKEQILGIFGRENVSLFPPHGLEDGHSFFAEPARTESGDLEPGRRYLGVMSASLGSMQTVQTRVAAATLQAAHIIPEQDRDGYWTNLNFLNSLRELGNTVSLLQSDVPDYLTGIRRRDGVDPRWPGTPLELTSRRKSDEIPKAIEQLQERYKPGSDRQTAVDICLASNIIEVGVDIDRLGLMTIVGQPKTTSQYIQVSGRVGRRYSQSPGLVITLYGAAKPRDRSHYERFFTYHQQLYAQVEPTSVTPFSAPVLRRALHASAVAHIRQTSPADLPPSPFPNDAYDDAIALLRERAKIVDDGELDSFDEWAGIRSRQWDSWERTSWNGNPRGGDPLQGLMRYSGTLPDSNSKALIWDVPSSMRNVDAECRLEISLKYLLNEDKIEG